MRSTGGHDRLVPSRVTNPRKDSVNGVPAPRPIASAHKHIRHSLGSQGRVLSEVHPEKANPLGTPPLSPQPLGTLSLLQEEGVKG